MMFWLAFCICIIGTVSGLPLLEVGDNPSGDGLELLLEVVFFWVPGTILAVLLIAWTVTCARYRRFQNGTEQFTAEQDNRAYLELGLEEQELYFQSKDYLETNPILEDELTLSQKLSIQEKGVMAWEFVKDPMLSNNELLVINKVELNFLKRFECSVQTNLPIPHTNDVYYFECKIYSLPKPEETIVSMGISTKPYPWFRLPGRHLHSVTYDSDGYRRFRQPFPIEGDPPFPKLAEGDVVGVGLRTRSGTVFFTRNGRKVSELKIGGHIKHFNLPSKMQLFPTIAANNTSSIHVNVGQLGFVYIEGNIKKWGFAPLEGNGPSPPMYKKFNGDILLERSEIDEESNIRDRENDFPPDFWEVNKDLDKFSYEALSLMSHDERITMHSILPKEPPTYGSHVVSGYRDDPDSADEEDLDLIGDDVEEFGTPVVGFSGDLAERHGGGAAGTNDAEGDVELGTEAADEESGAPANSENEQVAEVHEEHDGDAATTENAPESTGVEDGDLRPNNGEVGQADPEAGVVGDSAD